MMGYHRKHNPMAKALRDERYRQRVVKPDKVYDRAKANREVSGILEQLEYEDFSEEYNPHYLAEEDYD